MTDDERKARQNAHAAKFRESHPNYAREYQARRRKMISEGTWAFRHRVAPTDAGSSILGASTEAGNGAVTPSPADA